MSGPVSRSRDSGDEALDTSNPPIDEPLTNEIGRVAPEVVRLEVCDGVRPSGKPPVRIFLGTEAAQWRAERIFIWSIVCVRNPSRVYEITLMRELVDFDRTGWTTGFTNYRFAIPDLAGRRGRALYNDTDQIYLSDPAECFDLDMGDHGYLAIAPDGKVDTAVMLLDCERMSAVWTIEDARRRHKKKLIAAARGVPGLRGELPPEWHARDDGYTVEDRYQEGRSKCLHYTTLHMQPWRPDPDRFVYQRNPVGHLWYELEAQADDAGFQHLTRLRPSARFAAIASSRTSAASEQSKEDEVRETSSELAAACDALEESTGAIAAPVDVFDGPKPARGRSGGVLVDRGLGALPEDDVPWAVDELFDRGSAFVLAEIDCRGVKPPSGETATTLQTPAARWPDYFAAASRRRPEMAWHLMVRNERGLSHFHGGRWVGEGEPLVWLLCEDETDSSGRALLGLAEALGWPFSVHEPRRSRLSTPWPDVVIATGNDAADTARWLRERSGAQARVVLIGEGTGASTEGADLVVTPISEGYYPDPKRLEIDVPLPRWGSSELGDVSEAWRKLFDGVPGPHIALIVEGTGGMARLTPAHARQLATAALQRAASEGGSLFTLLDPRLPAGPREALGEALDCGGAHVELAPIGSDDPATIAHIALADAFIVADDEEALLGDVCAAPGPVWLLEAPPTSPTPTETMRGWVAAMARLERQNDRGTIRPQQGLELWCSQAIARGWIAPPRDLGRMRDALIESGAAAMLEDAEEIAERRGPDERARVVERIREIVGLGALAARVSPPEAREEPKRLEEREAMEARDAR